MCRWWWWRWLFLLLLLLWCASLHPCPRLYSSSLRERRQHNIACRTLSIKLTQVPVA